MRMPLRTRQPDKMQIVIENPYKSRVCVMEFCRVTTRQLPDKADNGTLGCEFLSGVSGNCRVPYPTECVDTSCLFSIIYSTDLVFVGLSGELLEVTATEKAWEW